MLYETPDDWTRAPHKRVALFGMSGLGKTRIAVVEGFLGTGGGGGGAAAPASGKPLKELFAASEVREVGRNRYEVT